MIGVGFVNKGNHNKVKIDTSFGDGELEAAITMGEALVRHQKGDVAVVLYNKNDLTKCKILKRIKNKRAGFLSFKRKVVTI